MSACSSNETAFAQVATGILIGIFGQCWLLKYVAVSYLLVGYRRRPTKVTKAYYKLKLTWPCRLSVH